MAYINSYLNACAAFGWEGGPEFRTRIVEMANGRERRNGDWAEARRKFTLPFLNISREKYVAILEQFDVCMGMLHTFRYSDPLDNTASNELIGFGDGVTEEFQLSKLTVIDGYSYRRNVYATPEDASLVVTLDGAPTEAFIVDNMRGILIFDTPPALNVAIRWSGAFDVWVRFNQDYLPFSIDNLDAHNGQVELLEMPPPPEEAS